HPIEPLALVLPSTVHAFVLVPSSTTTAAVVKGASPMVLVLLQTMIQSISSTLYWVGFYVGIRALPGDRWRRRRWAIGSALIFAAWLFGIVLLAGNGFFRFDIWPRGIPTALVMTLAAGYLFLLSRTFREIVASIPQHWLIAIQTFRILGGVFLVRYFQGELPGV